MRLKPWLFLSVVFFCACGQNHLITSKINPGSSGLLGAKQAAATAYPFALSAQVLNRDTQQPIQNFSVSVLADAGVDSVINPLGERNGIFHVSRNATSFGAAAIATLPILIQAPGFQSVVKNLALGSDCQAPGCPGSKPLAVLLPPILAAVASTTTPGNQTVQPSVVSANTAAKSAAAIFAGLVSQGKLDPSIQRTLSSAKNSDVLSNVLVLLNGNSAAAPSAVTGLLSGVNVGNLQNLAAALRGGSEGLAPFLAASNPQLGAALLAANTLLPYLTPLLSNNNATGQSAVGNLAPVLGALLKNNNLQGQLLNLMGALSQTKSGNAQLASAGLFPLLQSFFPAGPTNTANPAAGILSNALANPNLFNLFKSGKAGSANSALTYLQPILQSFNGGNSSALIGLFNQFVATNGGLGGIAGLANGGAANVPTKFSSLLPLLLPIARGLNSKDNLALTQLLTPFLEKANPGGSLKSLLGKNGGDNSTVSQVVSTVYPSLQNVLSSNVPSKQLLAAQLLQGFTSGQFKNLNVVRDLSTSNAVVVSGQARDIFKLAQLANITKILAPGADSNTQGQ